MHGVVGREMTIVNGSAQSHSDRNEYLDHGLYQCGYVVGVDKIDLKWEHDGVAGTPRLNYGDSFYCKPVVKHRLVAPENAQNAD